MNKIYKQAAKAIGLILTSGFVGIAAAYLTQLNFLYRISIATTSIWIGIHAFNIIFKMQQDVTKEQQKNAK